MLFVIYIYHVLYSTLDTLLTGLWTDEPCNADGDFLIVPQKGSKSSSSDYLPLVCNVFFATIFQKRVMFPDLAPQMWHSFGTMIVLL